MAKKNGLVDRDCEHCAKHTAEGCFVWECKFEPRWDCT